MSDETQPPPAPEVKHQSVDSRGNLHVLPWRTETRWSWALETGGNPELSVSAQIPTSMLAPKFESDGRAAKLDAGQINFSAASAQITSKLEYKEANGKPGQIHIVTVAKLPAPAAWADKSCADAQLSFVPRTPLPNPAPFLVVGFRCEEVVKATPKTPAKMRIDAYPLGVAVYKSSPLAKRDLPPSALKTRGKPAFSGEVTIRPSGKLGEMSFKESKDAKDARAVTFDILVAPTPEPRRWSLSAGVGVTVLSYKETGNNTVSFFQVGVTPKIASSFAVTRFFDVGVSIFGTALPIVASPASARFWGFNTRLGFLLPFKWFGATWKILPGWYTWGMLVPAQAFGVQVLAGPQVVFSVFKGGADSIPWGAYFKYAPTAESVGALSVGNCELALGGSVRVNSTKARYRVDLTLDASRTQFSAPSIGINMNMYTTTLGVQFDLAPLFYK